MKFKSYPYASGMFTVGLAVYGTITLLCLVGAILLPNGRSVLLFATAVGCFLLLILFCCMRSMLGRVSFDSEGVSMKTPLGYKNKLRWEDCADIGFTVVNESYVRKCMPWLYFSKSRLTQEQVYNKGKIRLKKDDIILIYCRAEVLAEVLKYIEKEQIRNMYLYTAFGRK